ncbi:alpha/beta hydrolase family protein [Desulfolutivibrio sulfoxidireducens]|uniref:alpha/beta hydrolase family protein n=1 Tax=Desulfolutivibrio sulfoxidireducens TaxID=2773299 RepID=UPI00159D6C8D|nr:CocE/NonD family hydrolase [Desulfolutivibrio sulfoxidireducens]QLA14773.1 alpha/beta hydrolase [Desulfolutivibrio sulfoxidireducens]
MTSKRNLRAAVCAVCCIFAAAFPLKAAQDAQDAQDAKAFDAHATTFNYFFKDGDMDFHFGTLVLGAAVNGGLEIGEAFYAASHIKDGDAAAWHAQWAALAERVAARGQAALAAGHTVSAREELLRAANYLRFSLISMLPDNPEFLKRGARVRELMRTAGPLFDPPLEYFEVPFEGRALPGYFQPAPGNGPRKTLLMIGGGETFAEDLYFYIAQRAIERGYNFVTVDLPGQGLLPAQGMVFRTDTYKPMKAVVDYVLSRPEVDPGRLAAYGISGGGLFVPQAAQRDPRIKAIAVSSAVVDAHTLFATMPAATATAQDMAAWSSFHSGVVHSICWRYGVDKPTDLVAANKGNTFTPAKVSVPALIIVGQGEYRSQEVRRQQKIAMDGFPNPAKKMVITPSDEGASNHCIMENRTLVGVVLFDWLDTVLK